MKSIILALVLAVGGVSAFVMMAATQAEAQNSAPKPKD